MRPQFLFMLFSLLIFSLSSPADDQLTFNESADWAKKTAESALAPSALPLNAADYCGDASCKRDIYNPKETRLNDSEINAKKGVAFATDDLAQDINTNFGKGRPNVKNDPAMQFALLGQENAFEITHGISNKYVDCDSGTQCNIDYTPQKCFQPTGTPVPCDKTPVATVITDTVLYECEAGWSLSGRDCHRRVVECRYDHYNRVKEVGGNCGRGNGFTKYWNGKIVKRGYWKGPRVSYSSYSCRGGEHDGYNASYQICSYVPETKPATLKCNEGFYLSGGNCIKNSFTWSTQCSLIKNCKPVSETCIEGEETRDVNGIPTTLPCWKYQVLHECDIDDSCSSLPSDCETTATTCSLKQNGVCVEEEVSKSCPKKTCHTTTLECGETSFCLDGDCYSEEPDLSGEFDKSVAALAGLSEAVKDIGDPPKIFTGKPMKCEKKAVGFKDCCRDSGWGGNLAKCSESEEALGKAKEKGLTLYVGQYCASKVFGVCTRKKRSYCVYDSKLAKIIQEQGAINQLGKRLGSAKHPTCAPITPEELGQINFEYIDFTEFYPEMRANTALPNFDEIKNRLQSSMGG